MIRPSTTLLWAALALLTVTGCATTPAPRFDPHTEWRRLEGTVRSQPGDTTAAFRHAVLRWLHKNDYRAADEELTALLRAAPTHSRALMLRAILHWSNGRYAELMRTALRLADVAPDAAETEVALVLLRFARELAPGYHREVTRALEQLARTSASPAIRDRSYRLLLLAQRRLKDVAGVAETQRRLGIIAPWRLTAPLGDVPVLDFERQLAPERDRLLKASYRDERGNRQPTTTDRYPNGTVHSHRLGRQGGQLYAESFVFVPTKTAATLRIISNRSVRVWLGSALAIVRNDYRRRGPSVRVRQVVLSPGWTRVRVKLSSNSAAGWFRLRLVPHQGTLRSAHAPGPEGSAAAPTLGRRGSTSERDLRQAWRRDPTDASALLGLWVLSKHWDRYDHEAAKRHLAALARVFPQSALVALLRGRSWLSDTTIPRKLALARAQAAFAFAERHWPKQLWANYYQGYILRLNGYHRKAIPFFTRSLRINPHFAWAQIQLFYAFSSLKWHREAETSLEKLTQLAESSTVAALAKRFFYQRHRFKDYRKALRLYDRISNALLTNSVAHDAIRRDDRRTAERRFRALIRHYPHELKHLKELYNLLYIEGRLDDAERLLVTLERLVPNSAEMGFQRGKLLFRRRGQAAAVRYWESVLKAHPRRVKLRQLLALLTGKPREPRQRHDAKVLLRDYRRDAQQQKALRSWGRYPTVTLLDGRYLRLHHDGSAIMVVHWIRLLQTKRAADRYGEWRPPKGARVLEMRTIKQDGAVVEPELNQKKGDLSFSGLNVGDAIEIAYVFTKARAFNVSGYVTTLVFRQINQPAYMLDYRIESQDGRTLKLYRHNDAPMPRISRIQRDGLNGTRYHWLHRNVQPIRAEPFRPSLREIYPIADLFFDVSRPWARIRDSYKATLLMATRPTFELRQLARRLKGKRPAETLNQVIDYLRDHVTQTGNALRFWPEASSIAASRKGNRVVLAVALLKLLRLPHRVLLIRPRNAAKIEPIPSPGFYYHPVIAVQLGSRWHWLDITQRYAVLGQWSEHYNNAPAMCLIGACEQVRQLPPQRPSETGWRFRFDVTVDKSGAVKGRLRADGIGQSARYLRYGLQRVAKRQAKLFFEKWLSSCFDGAQLSSMTVRNAKNPRKPLQVELVFEAPNGFVRSDGQLSMRRFFSRRISVPWGGGRPLVGYAQLSKRSLPLLIAPLREQLTVRLSLPTGTRLDSGPAAYRFTTRYGTLTRKLQLSGNVLTFSRNVTLRYARVQPEGYGRFREFVRKLIVLDRSPLRLTLAGTH